jgi:hypothetical protein
MKKNLSIFGLFTTILLTLNVSSASADPTYAVLDANGNVTNIIVCGSACASGEFAGNKVVLQVAADPVTGANRGGIWQGPGTTTYDSNTGVFTMNSPQLITNSETETNTDENENNLEVTSSVIINGIANYQFKYEDTLGAVIEYEKISIVPYSDQTSATVSVSADNSIQSIFFENRKTTQEIVEISSNSNLLLLNSKIQTLISLLGSWVK